MAVHRRVARIMGVFLIVGMCMAVSVCMIVVVVAMMIVTVVVIVPVPMFVIVRIPRHQHPQPLIEKRRANNDNRNGVNCNYQF